MQARRRSEEAAGALSRAEARRLRKPPRAVSSGSGRDRFPWQRGAGPGLSRWRFFGRGPGISLAALTPALNCCRRLSKNCLPRLPKPLIWSNLRVVARRRPSAEAADDDCDAASGRFRSRRRENWFARDLGLGVQRMSRVVGDLRIRVILMRM